MLVLSRYRGEKIRIGDDIWVTVVRVRRNGGVGLGIDAPRELEIVREELLGEQEAKPCQPSQTT